MGHKPAAQEMEKAQWFSRALEDEPLHIVNETRTQHGLLRRQMAHGFSEKSLRDQESIISGYVHLLLQKLEDNSKNGNAVVISDWYNYTTFDIIGDLAFREPFGCLKGSSYDGWIKGIFASARVGTILQALSFMPWHKRLLLMMLPESIKKAREDHKMFAEAKMRVPIAAGDKRPGLVQGLLKKKG